MRAITLVMLAGALFSSIAVGASPAEAGDHGKKYAKHRRAHDRDWDDHRRHEVRYVSVREVHVVREYYTPYHRSLPPGLAKKYYRTGHLPHGWRKRIRPLPVYVERDLIVLPHGYRRGVIDGHFVVYNPRTSVIVDLAVLF